MKKASLSCLLAVSCNASAFLVNPTIDGLALTNTIAGTGITIDTSTIKYIGADTQAGIFTDGLTTGMGIENGIILTSGNANLAGNSNTAGNVSANLERDGDSNLSALANGKLTQDANILEFDFTTNTGNLFFDFVFASEEYNEYLEFSDPFGLFVDGKNYALAPDGKSITVSNINCGKSGIGSGPNCSFFNNNSTGAYNIEYDGFTDVFTAKISGLDVGKTYTMKFAISDVNDGFFDSAVLVKGGSFSSEPEPVPEPATLALFSAGLLGTGLYRRRKTQA